MFATPKLPTELIEDVVEHIGLIHRETLKTASISAKCFLVPCQKALFCHIGLHYGGRNSPAKRLLGRLRVSPHLGTYVRFLGVFDAKGEEDELIGQGEEWSETHMDWLTRDQGAGNLLEILAGLGQITVFQCWLSRKTEYWDSLPTKAKTSIVSLCSAPSLSKLVVKSVPLQLVDFDPGPALKEMQIRFSDEEYQQPTASSTHLPVKLESLTLLGNEGTLDFAVGRIDLAYLRSLEIIEDMMGEPNLAKVLSLCRSLETLVTPSSAVVPGTALGLGVLSNLINLKHLKLDLLEPDERFSILLYDLLKTLRTPNPLESIWIKSPYSTAYEFLVWGPDVDPEWESVDKLLSNPLQFSELRIVDVCIYHSAVLAAEVIAMEDAFPRLHGAGLLTVSGH
ncbi:hypothetical protein BKA70DRAFT_479794 [Coprinopsis sp. MPI-PUGE-AT-0042]|nr:hypothetical protein BKA70DRAFT_479794 [Coprinopsis sp. MPI-PUGE-AT-0042]